MTKSKGIHEFKARSNWLDRFWSRINKKSDNECWEWLGGCNSRGYGRIVVNQQVKSVHRISWEIHKGNIPEGFHVLHKCDNPKCVNPNHLFLGTNLDNIADKMNKGRQSKGEERPASKLKDSDIVKIRELRIQGLTYTELSKIFGVATGQLCLITQRKAWKHV